MHCDPHTWERQDKIAGDDWQFQLSSATPIHGTAAVIPGNSYLINGAITVCPVGITTASAWAVLIGNNPIISTPFNLTGWTPGGWLILPLPGAPLSLVGMYDTSQIATGMLTLTIPRMITAVLEPDESGYRIQVTLTDPYDTLSTVLVIPLRVGAV